MASWKSQHRANVLKSDGLYNRPLEQKVTNKNDMNFVFAISSKAVIWQELDIEKWGGGGGGIVDKHDTDHRMGKVKRL